MKKHFDIFFICFIINIFSSIQELKNYQFLMNINEKGFFIEDKAENRICDIWSPSLFLPLLLISKNIKIDYGEIIENLDSTLKTPFINNNEPFPVEFYKNVPYLNKDFQGKLMTPVLTLVDVKYCYFGISHGIGLEGLGEEFINLNNLKIDGKIDKKIFSFGLWDISDPKNLKANFYLGKSNDVFNSNDGIIGTCENYPKDSLWGCSFKEMKFNNINIPLKINGTEIFYKIYFSSETHNLIFPKFFREIFKDETKNLCSFNSEDYLECKGIFDDSKYVPLHLTENNDNFVITGQVDNLNRFNQNNDEKKDYARVQIKDIDFIILPLIVFKKFHLEFDAENDLIRFYTDDSTILKVKETKKGGFSGFTIFIIIFIILIVLGLGFGAYWFIKNIQKPEKNINQFSKYEDEENYQNMNDKVF
jgi:hypothetical protein